MLLLTGEFGDATTRLPDWAEWYSARRIPVFPLIPLDKKPLTSNGFKDATLDSQQVKRWWKLHPNANIGIPTGSRSGLLLVDIDPRSGGEESLRSLILKHGPFPRTAEQMTGGGGRHFLFRYPGGSVPKTLSDGIDLKGDGGYFVAAPSVHPSGSRYEWDGLDGAKALLEPAQLPSWIQDRIAEKSRPGHINSEPAEKTWKPGERNNKLAEIVGSLRRKGFSVEIIFSLLLGINGKQCDPPLPKDEVEQIARSIGRYPPSVAGLSSTEWPEPESLRSELPFVEPFRAELVPSSLRPLVSDVAERMQVPIDYPAVVLVLCLAGLVNRRAFIQPKANDTGWLVVPNLWGGIIAPPGFMKSPVIQAVTRPLTQIQSAWLKAFENGQHEYALKKEEDDLRRSAWREQFKRSAKKDDPMPDRPSASLREPTLKRLIVNDATFEALHETMRENPFGILAIRDELTGWWSQLDSPGREGDRGFFLQAWNGDAAYTTDRVKRGMTHAEACCMSMLGGLQPARLRTYLVDAVNDGPGNDGLIQRFQLLVWPDHDRPWKYVDRTPNAEAEQAAERIFSKLLDLESHPRPTFRFDAEAQSLFVEWLGTLEEKLRCEEVHPALISHLSKYRKLMPALALLFHLADWAAGVTTSDSISLEHATRAKDWCEYLESHANRIYSCVISPRLKQARDLSEKVASGKIGADGPFTYRDIYTKGWSGLDSVESAKAAVEVLRDAGWVRPLEVPTGPQGGRPSPQFEVNPAVRK